MSISRAAGQRGADWLLAVTAVLALASPAVASPRGTVPPALVGSFSTAIGKVEYRFGLLPGRYTISFAADGAVFFAEPAAPKGRVTWVTASGKRILFSPGARCPTTRGTYRWVIRGRILTFVKIADPCPVRVLTFANRNWIKVT